MPTMLLEGSMADQRYVARSLASSSAVRGVLRTRAGPSVAPPKGACARVGIGGFTKAEVLGRFWEVLVLALGFPDR